MNVLIINSVCGIGSTGKICFQAAQEFEAQGHTVKIAYGRDGFVPDACKPYAVRIGTDLGVRLHGIYSRITDRHAFGSKAATKKFLAWAEQYDPDLLWLHNLHGYYLHIGLLFRWIKSRPHMQVQWTLHDCWSFTGHCAHFDYIGCEKWKTGCHSCPQKSSYPGSLLWDASAKNYTQKKALFTGIPNMTLITPSVWLAEKVKQSFLGEYPVQVRYNTIDETVFQPTPGDFRQRHHLDGKTVILGVASAWSDRKGLSDFTKLRQLLGEDYAIVLVGLTEQQCQLVPAGIIALPRTHSAGELAQIYTAADIFVNLTYEDTYPTVNLEAQACGTPVVCYDTGGCKETLNASGILIPKGDLQAAVGAISKLQRNKRGLSMRIVHIEDFFHADAGYQINILAKYFVQAGHEVIIVTSQMDIIPDELTKFFGKDNVSQTDKAYEDAYGVKIIRVPARRYVSGRVIYTSQIFSTVDSLKPDLLFVHGNDTLIGMQYILKAKKLPYPIVSDSHMLEMASTNKFNKLFRAFYKRFITPKLIRQGIPVIRTQDDPYVEKHLGIPLSMCPWISYGSDVMLFHPDAEVKAQFRKDNGIADDAFVAVFTGKLIASKGAMLLAEAFRKKFRTDRQVVLIAVGNTSGDYGKQVEDTFAQSENTILRFPTQKYAALAPFYQAADLSVFAKQCSLSFYDAQACGLPVVSEDNNINVDRCSHGNGMCFRSDDVEDFREKIQSFLDMPPEEIAVYKKNSLDFILSEYDYSQKAREYLDIVEDAYARFHKA